MHHLQRMTAVILTTFLFLWSYGVLAQMQAQRTTSSKSSTTSSQKAGLRGDALFKYDTETGTLIVITDEKTNAEIKKVVEAMDKPIPQVLIKVLFLEVTHTKDLTLGFEGSRTHSKTHLFSSQVDTATLEAIFGVSSQTTGGFYRLVENDLEATIQALSEVTKLEVLSRPSILAKNNQEAQITVGKRVPFIQNSRVTSDGQTINTVTYDDIGIILNVTPHITDDRIVSMDVTPEISTLTAETVPISDTIDAPVFATRAAETGVVVPDGKTVVIGGLMEDSKSKSDKRIPILGDIPLIGNLFKDQTNSKSKTELLIFLTPHVVQNDTELQTLSAREKDNSTLTPKAFDQKQMNQFLDSPNTADPKADAAPQVNTTIKLKGEKEATTTVSTPVPLSKDTAQDVPADDADKAKDKKKGLIRKKE